MLIHSVPVKRLLTCDERSVTLRREMSLTTVATLASGAMAIPRGRRRLGVVLLSVAAGV